MISIGSVIAGGTAALLMQNLFPPVSDYWARFANDKMPERILPLGDILNLLHRQDISSNEFKNLLRQSGFDTEFAELLAKSSYTKLNVHDYVSAYRRGLISQDSLYANLKALHVSDDDIEIYLQSSLYFPSPADLVTFAVREVYTPSIREKFGLDKDRPQQFIEESFKAGLPREQAENYWASHWQLPSSMQGFEMLHRDVISTEELSMLLKALDITPFWREKLQEISYNPLTRVDVRRMYGMGVLTEDGVKRAYKDIGYNDKNAELMTEFTKRYTAESSNELTRSSILSAFKKDIIPEEEARTYLTGIGYSEENVTFYLNLAIYEKLEEETDEYIEELKSWYLLGELTLEEIRTQLNTMDLASSHINSIINKLQKQTSQKVKLPSKAELERWLKLNIIEENEYSTKMSMLGYRTSDIQKYLTEINLEVDTSTRKYLPITTYQRWLKTDIMTEKELEKTSIDMNILSIDIERMIQEVNVQKYGEEETEV